MWNPFRLFGFLWWLALLAASCKKERSCENCLPDSPQPGAPANQRPIARAGVDQVVKLPTDSTLLDGRASSDPDGRVVAWGWRQVEGAAPSSIVRADVAVTSVRALVLGRYAYELKVMDDKGLSARDTVVIDVRVDTGINFPLR